jgi:hypothetical protein
MSKPYLGKKVGYRCGSTFFSVDRQMQHLVLSTSPTPLLQRYPIKQGCVGVLWTLFPFTFRNAACSSQLVGSISSFTLIPLDRSVAMLPA